MTKDQKLKAALMTQRAFPGELYQHGIPPSVRRAVDHAIAVGNIKFGRGFTSHEDKAIYLEKVKRHLGRFEDGDIVDADDGQHPLASVIYRCCQLIALDLKGKK